MTALKKAYAAAEAALEKKAYDLVVLDYDDVVIHLFYEPAREFYRLETNWIDAHEVKLPEPIRKQAEGLRIRAIG